MHGLCNLNKCSNYVEAELSKNINTVSYFFPKLHPKTRIKRKIDELVEEYCKKKSISL